MSSEKRIFEIVNNEEDLLNTAVEEYPDTDYDNLKKIGIDFIQDYPDGYINFCCGNGYQEYTGFYYSEADAPMGWEGEDMTLEEHGEGWAYNGWCDYYTQRIREHWFYYIAFI